MIELNDRVRGHLILELFACISEYFTDYKFQSDGPDYTYGMKEKSKRNFKLFALDLHPGHDDHIKDRIKPRTTPAKSLNTSFLVVHEKYFTFFYIVFPSSLFSP